ncbi:G5 domain-containing protein [Sporobacter termitidis DSM 10068]|uniref:G5 domain-containing protein n=1 Tax=Sporobacter termitidis DSM 10068 TaxID=1123282 RepID=A0A1M5Y517_9FIRM|nr:VanW family protein [Sporobacter termitidis]SHI07185.1 G5 domain-containing protein [Sporobacter termitidis DSM 10068]
MKRPGVIAGIIAGAVVVVLVAGVAIAGLYINKMDTVYPNITVGGVNLSGMTLDEAEKALTDAGYEEKAANVAVTVVYPDGEELTITGKESGVRLPADRAAKLAYDYGKDGSFLGKEMKYIGGLFGARELDRSGVETIDEAYVRGIVSDYTQKFNEKLSQGAYTLTNSSIDIVKGSGGAVADAGAVYDLVVDSLSKSVEQNSPVTAEYSIGTDGGDDIDLQSIYDSVHTEPVDAVYDKTTHQATQSQVGVSFDVDAAQKQLGAAKTGATVSVPLIRTDPQVSTEQLQSLLFRDVLSEKATHVAGTSNRINNVVLSAKAVNGTILNPGDTFSYNDTLGERTAAKGYKEAGAYAGGEVIQEIGGGICQTSSTLYYCVLYANLQVVERSNHMFIVTYLPLGDDATVNWGTIDFKFKNNTNYPIKIESTYKDGNLTVRLYGTKTDTNRVEIKYDVISTTDFKTVQKEDASVAPGKTKVQVSGCKGYVVKSYKYIYDAAGNLLSKTAISPSNYKPENRVVLVPVGALTGTSPSPSSTPPPASPSATVSAEPSPSPSEEASEPPPV